MGGLDWVEKSTPTQHGISSAHQPPTPPTSTPTPTDRLTYLPVLLLPFRQLREVVQPREGAAAVRPGAGAEGGGGRGRAEEAADGAAVGLRPGAERLIRGAGAAAAAASALPRGGEQGEVLLGRRRRRWRGGLGLPAAAGVVVRRGGLQPIRPPLPACWAGPIPAALLNRAVAVVCVCVWPQSVINKPLTHSLNPIESSRPK